MSVVVLLTGCDITKMKTKSYEKENSVVVKKDTKEDANEAIRKALKDEKWLSDNGITFSKEVIDGFLGLEPTYTFTKINDVDGMPAYMVCSDLESEHAVIVTYKDGEVILTASHGYDYEKLRLDKENEILEAENMSAGGLRYYQIKDGRFELIEVFGTDDYEKGKEKYSKYNFNEITTELTESAIDEIVK